MAPVLALTGLLANPVNFTDTVSYINALLLPDLHRGQMHI